MIVKELKNKIENAAFINSNIISILLVFLLVRGNLRLSNDFEYVLLCITSWFLFTCVAYSLNLKIINNAFLVFVKKMQRIEEKAKLEKSA